MRFVKALASIVCGRALTGLEDGVLEDAVTIVTRRMREPFLGDLLDVLREPPDQMCTELAKGQGAILDGTDELRFRLRSLVSGSLSGMFNGPTNVGVDTRRGVVLDLSGAGTDVLTRLPKGRALIVCEGRRAVVDFTLSPMLERLTYTNQAIAR